ncbi:unnamed protein product [Medioppia subpectinata]|uniref:Uncharacterized protein n=1 Tax=Medioppia subpectinata TaxID=1979941 RepID=A0A7R9KIJ1_9ACAR|nr:unnamed protein product [Medioppia subpectinata]CAG2104148.1 unnamed protein product [Medioppia subpectinata]
MRRTKETVSSLGKAVLITGCDTGFGNRLALKLNRNGYRVYATVLSVGSKGSQELAERATFVDKMHVLEMDVTDDTQVLDAYKHVRKDVLLSRPVVGSSMHRMLGLISLVISTAIASRLCSPPLHFSTVVSRISVIIKSVKTLSTMEWWSTLFSLLQTHNQLFSGVLAHKTRFNLSVSIEIKPRTLVQTFGVKFAINTFEQVIQKHKLKINYGGLTDVGSIYT